MTQHDSGPNHPGPPVPAQRPRQPVPPAPAHPPPLAPAPLAPASPGAGPPPAAGSPGAAPAVHGRPRHLSGWLSWIFVGAARNPRGVFGALIGTWFYLPFALVVAAIAGVGLGLVGFLGGSVRDVPALVTEVPILAPALEVLLSRSGGVFGGLLGAVLGALLGFLGALLLFWHLQFAEDPLAGVGSLVGVVGFGLLLGLVYTGYRLLFEPALLRAAGARRMSRRERALLLPIVQACTARLGLPNHPPVLVSDDPEPVAAAHCRHLVLSRGLLATLRHEPEPIAGVVAHALVHWRNGDPVAAAFVRGVALPLYLVYSAASWLLRRVGHPVVAVAVWLLVWPVLVTVRWVVIPLQAADTRRAEHRADQGAVLAGHRDGLRTALAWLPGTFEAGHNSWQRALCRTHPPPELRLEALEDPAGQYPLTEPEPAR